MLRALQRLRPPPFPHTRPAALTPSRSASSSMSPLANCSVGGQPAPSFFLAVASGAVVASGAAVVDHPHHLFPCPCHSGAQCVAKRAGQGRQARQGQDQNAGGLVRGLAAPGCVPFLTTACAALAPATVAPSSSCPPGHGRPWRHSRRLASGHGQHHAGNVAGAAEREGVCHAVTGGALTLS